MNDGELHQDQDAVPRHVVATGSAVLHVLQQVAHGVRALPCGAPRPDRPPTHGTSAARCSAAARTPATQRQPSPAAAPTGCTALASAKTAPPFSCHARAHGARLFDLGTCERRGRFGADLDVSIRPDFEAGLGRRVAQQVFDRLRVRVLIADHLQTRELTTEREGKSLCAISSDRVHVAA